MLILVLVSAGILVFTAYRDPQDSSRARAQGLLGFLGEPSCSPPAWAGDEPEWASGRVHLSYVIDPDPVHDLSRLGLNGSRVQGLLVQAGLFLCLVVATCINIPVSVRAGRKDHLARGILNAIF